MKSKNEIPDRLVLQYKNDQKTMELINDFRKQLNMSNIVEAARVLILKGYEQYLKEQAILSTMS